MRQLTILPENIHTSWSEFLSEYRYEQLTDIEQQLGSRFDPAPERVMHFLQTDLKAVKVVILGQDPYPQPGVATGRAFEVGGLTSWLQPFRQASLRNILRLLYKIYSGIEEYSDIPTWNALKQEIKSGSFRILPPNQLFQSWEEQGVLLLNPCLTVNGTPLSHQAIWQDFAFDLIQFISWQRTDLHWFLWGKNAQTLMPMIDYGTFYPCRHPMMCSSKYEDDFLLSDCFKETMGEINWLGK